MFQRIKKWFAGNSSQSRAAAPSTLTSMRTRCKTGDLAFITGIAGVNAGKIVKVGRYLGRSPIMYDASEWGYDEYSGSHMWECHSTGGIAVFTDGIQSSIEHVLPIQDQWLTPIRDQEGEDEMIRITGIPADTATKMPTTQQVQKCQ